MCVNQAAALPLQYLLGICLYDADAEKKEMLGRNPRAESSCARVHRITGAVSIWRAEVIASEVCME